MIKLKFLQSKNLKLVIFCIQGAPGDVAPSYGLDNEMIQPLLKYLQWISA